ncbi:CoA transferase subunit A [Acuticoccus sp. I52.16.1]|uniref:CoA transferase subunit A n=1 Tax=Acuticoccus sp. I52.16.1 TaxID=2928472 RepID=UPI001FD1BD03|nr:CoA transferase [Acuticoccus sp. I52.16.1]UOM33164.1 CoA synthetase [Acuticoccus sp. I52.16.1]
MTVETPLDRLAEAIPDGAKLAIPADYAGVSMAMVGPLLRRGARDLHLVCVPTSGIQADLLIGAGAVATVETSAVTLGEAGGAPAFGRAVRSGAVRVLDATCPAIHAGLIAAQKGAPFLPMRGLIGSDILANRPDWRVIDNPFADAGDPVVLIPAIVPDVALFHAPAADRFGNVAIGRRRELATMAYAARRTIVTVERILDTDLMADEASAAGTLPALYVDGIGLAPGGAAPLALWGEYETDVAAVKAYAAAARSPEALAAYIDALMGRVPA